MTNTAYLDVAAHSIPAQQHPLGSGLITPPSRSDVYNIYCSPVTLVLQDVLFTGNVTMANWTFAISVFDKLWISKKTSLYFGKTRRINRPVYTGKMNVINHKVNMDVKITAYNMYGDVIKSHQQLRMFFLNGKRFYQTLLQAEHDRTCMSFKLAAMLGKKCK